MKALLPEVREGWMGWLGADRGGPAPSPPSNTAPPKKPQVEHGVCEREFQALKLCVRGALRKCLAASRR